MKTMSEEKEKIQKKLFAKMKKYGTLKCMVCGDDIRLYDVEQMNFEYISNKRGEIYIHSRCKEK